MSASYDIWMKRFIREIQAVPSFQELKKEKFRGHLKVLLDFSMNGAEVAHIDRSESLNLRDYAASSDYSYTLKSIGEPKTASDLIDGADVGNTVLPI